MTYDYVYIQHQTNGQMLFGDAEPQGESVRCFIQILRLFPLILNQKCSIHFYLSSGTRSFVSVLETDGGLLFWSDVQCTSEIKRGRKVQVNENDTYNKLTSQLQSIQYL